jgi:hypothetical protein
MHLEGGEVLELAKDLQEDNLKKLSETQDEQAWAYFIPVCYCIFT